jgi:hypothetical protein
LNRTKVIKVRFVNKRKKYITKFSNFRAENGNGGGYRDRLANKQDKLFVTVKGQRCVSKHVDCCVLQESNRTKVIRVEFDNKIRNLFYNHECTEISRKPCKPKCQGSKLHLKVINCCVVSMK